jgi:uncharacterized protein
MTPQESQLVADLFDRLAKLETVPRDPGAERVIADGLQRAPHAVYALVQTALLQDEALKRANARIEELQAQVDNTDVPPQRQGSFLDSMRDMFAPREPRGSVPNVRSGSTSAGGYQSQTAAPQSAYPPQMPPPGYPGAPGFGSGGSFLGTAASAAAGVIGGALLLDGIRSMFGHHVGGYGQSALGDFAGDRASPWSGTTGGSASDSDLARDLGINDIGHQGGNAQSLADADALQDAQQDADDDQDFADDDYGGDDGGGDGGFSDA